ncbi:MAG: hypothetical protein L0H53_04025 [Candidatus Nitrosocosmicus sp.]|nr:hypothetical protein [Candidatus Nitrosocosmicus sp.]
MNFESDVYNYHVLRQAASKSVTDKPTQSIPKDIVKSKSFQRLSLERGQPAAIANSTENLILLNSQETACIFCM